MAAATAAAAGVTCVPCEGWSTLVNPGQRWLTNRAQDSSGNQSLCMFYVHVWLACLLTCVYGQQPLRANHSMQRL